MWVKTRNKTSDLLTQTAMHNSRGACLKGQYKTNKSKSVTRERQVPDDPWL